MKNRVFLTAQALLCVLVAALLAAAALQLYVEGAAIQAEGDLFYYIYTRERVEERLAPLLPLIFASIGMTVVGWLLGIRDERADRPARDVESLRDLTCARIETPDAAMIAERTLQKRLRVGVGLAFALCMVPVALYACNGANFSRPLDAEADLRALMAFCGPRTLAGIACLTVSSVLMDRSMQREIAAAKALPMTKRPEGAKPPLKGEVARSARGVMKGTSCPVALLRMVFVIVAVLFIVAGILNGGLEDVITKANAICMECVGLG